MNQLGAWFPAFQSRDYRVVWFASGAAAVSLWMLLMARAWLALELSGQGLAVGAVTFAAMAPWALAPFGGLVADRFDRAHVVIVARLVLCALALGLAALAFAGAITVWQLVLFAAATGVVRAVEMPAETALLPNTVAPDSLLNAITLASLVRFGSRMIGPLAGAPLLAGAGAGWLFVMGAIFYVVSAITLLGLQLRSSGGIDTGAGWRATFRAHVQEGVRYIGATPAVRLVIFLVALHCMLAMSFDALLPILARRELAGGEGTFGALLIGVGGGALAGTLLLSFMSPGAIRGRAFATTGVASGLGVIALGLAPTVPLAVAAAAATGAAQASFMALSATLIQGVVPDALRGRVMSLYVMMAAGVMAIMILANGAIADVVSVRPLLIAPAALFIVLLIAWSASAPALRAIYRAGALPHAPAPVPAPASGD